MSTPLDSTNTNATPAVSAWPGRLARVLVAATFPLIFVGGLVTTYDAGMAVPDWPNTYGYNLFLYPLATWIAGPFNVFVEHGHRLLGAAVGFLTIGLLLAVWLRDGRKWLKYALVFAFVLVCFQGVLGGTRVLRNDRGFAQLHACVAPLFFATVVALAIFTSLRWRAKSPPTEQPGAGRLQFLCLLTAILAYLQIVAGTFLRHFPLDGDYRDFRAAVIVHLALAVILLLHGIWLSIAVYTKHRRTAIAGPALRLAILLTLQVALGAATYVLKYNWPEWFAGFEWAATNVIERRAFWPAVITTAHVAVGALVFVTAVSACLWSFRTYRFASLPNVATLPTLLSGVTA